MRKATRAKIAASCAIASFLVMTGITHPLTATADPSSAPGDTAAVEDFASDVETIGETKFADTFAGGSLASDGVLTVYVTLPIDTALTAAIVAANANSYPVDFVGVSKSFNQLDRLMSSMDPHISTLEQDGVAVNYWAPNPAAGNVDVTLRKPTSSDLTQISRFASRGTAPLGDDPVDVSDYAQAASRVISTVVGSNFTVNSTFEPAIQTTDPSATTAPGASEPSTSAQPDVVQPDVGRTDGVAPFVAGDDIREGLYPWDHRCESGFSVIGNNSLEPFMFAAGHCGSYTWETPAQTIGPTSTIYMKNSTLDDFQTIRVNSSVRGSVNVDNSPGQYEILGPRAVAAGSHVGIDSRPNNYGTQYNVPVVQIDAAVTESNDGGFTVHHVIITSGKCSLGDSGGPVIQRNTAHTAAYAVGTILGTNGGQCFAEGIYEQLKVSNTSLVLHGSVVNR